MGNGIGFVRTGGFENDVQKDTWEMMLCVLMVNVILM